MEENPGEEFIGGGGGEEMFGARQVGDSHGDLGPFLLVPVVGLCCVVNNGALFY